MNRKSISFSSQKKEENLEKPGSNQKKFIKSKRKTTPSPKKSPRP